MSEENKVAETTMSGVDIVLSRMDTHPEEFYSNCEKWRFIYKDYFRDSMTEVQKGLIFEKIKRVRMQEFNEMVLTTLVESDKEKEEVEESEYEFATPRNTFGNAPMKAQGTGVNYKWAKKK